MTGDECILFAIIVGFNYCFFYWNLQIEMEQMICSWVS